MLTFEKFMAEEFGELSEKLITFARQAYPKFGNIVILAGGAGSGKGFVKDKLVGLEGYTFDVDDLKSLAAKAPGIIKKVKAEFGDDLVALAGNLRNDKNVGRLHQLIGDELRLDDKRMQALYASILTAAPDRKPNIIFDVTLKDLEKLRKIALQVQNLGYAPELTHILWVVNDIEVAQKQNAARDRIVPPEILVNTHRGAAQTMLDIIDMGQTLKKYMDGDIVFAFNKVGVDSDLQKSGKGGSYVKTANYFYIKRSGMPVMALDDINADIRRKIADYVPKNIEWI